MTMSISITFVPANTLEWRAEHHAVTCTMPIAIKLDQRKPITYESALNKDANIISQAAYLEAATELYQSLSGTRDKLLKHLLGTI